MGEKMGRPLTAPHLLPPPACLQILKAQKKMQAAQAALLQAAA